MMLFLALKAGRSGYMRAGIDLMQRPAVVDRCPALSYRNDLMKLNILHISYRAYFGPYCESLLSC